MIDEADGNKKTDSPRGENNVEIRLGQPIQIDWQKTIGLTVQSKENLDMGTVIVDHDKDYGTSYSITIEYGDHERFSIPKDTIYRVDEKNLYTTLTENEILASRRNDPFGTSMRSYTDDT
jgi:hypothetical protein